MWSTMSQSMMKVSVSIKKQPMKKQYRNKRFTTIILTIPSFLLAFFLAPKIWYANPTDDEMSYFKNITDWLSKAVDADSKKALLTVYCDTMMNPDIQNWYLDKANNSIYYSPKFSLFVQALCYWLDNDYTTFNKQNMIIGTSWDSILWNTPQWCNWDMKKCDLSELLPALFNAIMNDHSTLSIAWWTFTKDTNKVIDEFSETYFWDASKLCKDKVQYIWQKSAASKIDELCSHPMTHQALKNTIETMGLQKKNLRIIKWDEFWANTPKNDCNISTPNFYDNLFVCAYTNKSKNDAGKFQYNLRYNELLYYKLLLAWLSNDKLLDERITPLTISSSSNTTKKNDEIQNLKREEMVSDKAIEIMQKSIDNIRATLPIHFWLQAYYEDVVRFRQSLAKIYTPIHQLNYKLRNIQEKK